MHDGIVGQEVGYIRDCQSQGTYGQTAIHKYQWTIYHIFVMWDEKKKSSQAQGELVDFTYVRTQTLEIRDAVLHSSSSFIHFLISFHW